MLLFTCCGPCAMLACRTKATDDGFLIAASVSSVARHCDCARRPIRILISNGTASLHPMPRSTSRANTCASCADILVDQTSASNIAECILDRMPKVQNGPATYAVFQTCHDKFPYGYAEIEKGSGRGWFGFESGAECAAKKSSDTPSPQAASAIRAACNCLYDRPQYEGQRCA